jgi:hypothetical protein
MADARTHAAATALAQELREALNDLPYRPALPVRVISAGELADEVRKVCAASGDQVYGRPSLAAPMGSAFVVQQRDGPGRTWRTVTGDTTLAAASGFADKLQHALDDLPYVPSPPVRVISTEQRADEARIRGHAAELLKRGSAMGR